MYIIEEIKDLNFEQQHIEYKKYYENIQNEMLKSCGIPKDLYEKRKKLNYDTRRER